MFSKKTKIVCSIGPAVGNDEIVEKLILAGMNVARFNFSHGTHESHRENMERVKRCSQKVGRPVALLLDTKGPEIRTGMVPNDGTVTINAGDIVHVRIDGAETIPSENGKPAIISLNWQGLLAKAKKGIRILIADGLLELDAEEITDEAVICRAANTGTISSRKNVNIIGFHAGLPIMSETDKADIAFGVKMNVDFIAASFVSFPSEVYEIRQYLDSLDSKAKIIAKIENEEGLDNIKEIIQAADGIMIARGDMGVQLPTERIPLAQKHIISECRKAGKPVITATQMLDSMIVNPRPTRAELTDVANAIFDGTDAVMLSGETANGAYPVESVETMARIAVTVEDSPDYCEKMRESFPEHMNSGNLGQIVARMSYLTATEVKAMVIITPTMSGTTARMISMFRPEQAVLAVTPNPQVQRQLLLNWGVVPFLSTKIADDSEEMVQTAIKTALDVGAVQLSDRIVMCAGIPLASPLMVNTVKVLLVGNVLARGLSGGVSSGVKANRSHGRVVKARTPEEAYTVLRKTSGEILVCPRIDQSWIPILRFVEGVIVENDVEIPVDTMPLINTRLVWIEQVNGALVTLETGLTVTVDGKELLVYEGII